MLVMVSVPWVRNKVWEDFCVNRECTLKITRCTLDLTWGQHLSAIHSVKHPTFGFLSETVIKGTILGSQLKKGSTASLNCFQSMDSPSHDSTRVKFNSRNIYLYHYFFQKKQYLGLPETAPDTKVEITGFCWLFTLAKTWKRSPSLAIANKIRGIGNIAPNKLQKNPKKRVKYPCK